MSRSEHDVIKKFVYPLGHLRCSYSAIVKGTNSVGTFSARDILHCNRVLQENEQEH